MLFNVKCTFGLSVFGLIAFSLIAFGFFEFGHIKNHSFNFSENLYSAFKNSTIFLVVSGP